ncbi:MAG: ABC transporter substrate-binding protein [Planctomycetia bacterium]|nr:ABC transporter substrate-binding protein [Planctomycetia bacterium]
MRLLTIFVILCGFVSVVLSEESKSGSSQTTKDTSGDGTVVRVAFYDFPSIPFLGFIAAQKLGYFEQEKIPQVELIWRKDLQTVFDLLKEGKADFAVTWMGEGIRTAADGFDIVAIARLSQEATEAIYVRRDINPTYHEPRDLDGRKVGVAFRRDSNARAYFKHIGVTPITVTFRPESGFVFNEGVVDAVIMPRFNVDVYCQYTRFRGQVRSYALSKQGITYPEDTVFCTRAFRTQKADLCKRFMRAVWRGWETVGADRQRGVEILSSYSNHGDLPNDLFYLSQELEKWYPFLHFNKENLEENGNCNHADFEQLRTDMIAAGLVESSKAPEFKTFFDFAGAPDFLTKKRDSAKVHGEKKK